MQQTKKSPTRKKFLLWSAAMISSFTFLRLFNGPKKSSPKNGGDTNTVKMLTQDGKLVEVDIEKLYCGKRKKISDEQLKNWVTKKQSNPQG
jgi:hypothetical protein